MIKKKLPIFGWALYDFASTIFSTNVISLYFVLWITVDKGREDILYSIALSGSLLLAAVLQPLLGIVSDIYRRKMPFLVFFTCLACIFTAFLAGVRGVFAGLLVFAMANIVYQIAAVFYNSLLVDVCGKEEIGRVSGLGVAVSYIGMIVGLILTRPLVLKYGYQAAFIPTAALFFIFSLPCFFMVKESALKADMKSKLDIRKVFLRIKDTFSNSRKYPGLSRFIIAVFIYLNAINTIVVFLAVYLKKIGGFYDGELITIYIFSAFMAIIGSLFFGMITDRLGAKRALMISLALGSVCLILGAFACVKVFFWILGPFAGILIGSVWTTTRAFAIKLCPEEKLGEIFGFLGMVGKSSAILGPLVWGLSVLTFGFMGLFKYRIAILIQDAFILFGWVLISGVPGDVPERERK